ncbi:unnamed protein product [Prorocentrum cordatum]|uniref:Uncharacterized protein n=1 Tax=Prorocentrum cordatum TaxID=2364126 RepID=A0ABN9PTT4_9DINO|nr:unnamed protein product [Polarella glacialis]
MAGPAPASLGPNAPWFAWLLGLCASNVATTTMAAAAETSATETECIYKFTPTKLRNESTFVHFAEIEFMSSGSQVAVTGAANPGGSNPSLETPEMAIDGSILTKWADVNMQALVLTILDCTAEPDSFRFITASDEYSNDPVQWTLHKYIGSSWVVVHAQDVDYPTPTARYTPTEWFQFPGVMSLVVLSIGYSENAMGQYFHFDWAAELGSGTVSWPVMRQCRSGVELASGVGVLWGNSTGGTSGNAQGRFDDNSTLHNDWQVGDIATNGACQTIYSIISWVYCIGQSSVLDSSRFAGLNHVESSRSC